MTEPSWKMKATTIIAATLMTRQEWEQEVATHNVPARLAEGLWRYAAGHVPTGGFLEAVLENNLVNAIAYSDAESLAHLQDIVRLCHWALPGQSWGSREKVQAWLKGNWATDARAQKAD